jgi:ankyrin repeat protein
MNIKLFLIPVVIQLSAYAMQQNNAYINGQHELTRYTDIIPHINCNHPNQCGYCCEYANYRHVTQCFNCSYCVHQPQHLPKPTNIIKKQTDKEKELLIACNSGFHSKVIELLKSGINPNTRETQGLTPLMLAAAGRHVEIVEVLLEAKSNPNVLSFKGETALTFVTSILFEEESVVASSLKITEKLLAAHADPDLHAWDLNPPLINALIAKRKGHAIVRALLAAHASPLHKNPLQWADNEMAHLLRQHIQSREKSS